MKKSLLFLMILAAATFCFAGGNNDRELVEKAVKAMPREYRGNLIPEDVVVVYNIDSYFSDESEAMREFTPRERTALRKFFTENVAFTLKHSLPLYVNINHTSFTKTMKGIDSRFLPYFLSSILAHEYYCHVISGSDDEDYCLGIEITILRHFLLMHRFDGIEPSVERYIQRIEAVRTEMRAGQSAPPENK
ncbi:MAG: hypothetical protein Q7R94_01020 [bacterium]|nr:hypothetical protein [bacterium]